MTSLTSGRGRDHPRNNDPVYGQDDNDKLYGGNNNDKLYCGAGTDGHNCGPGVDSADGGPNPGDYWLAPGVNGLCEVPIDIP